MDSPIPKVLVISNDSEVFLKTGITSAFEMFGGRLTEVKNLVARLDPVCDISFGIISGFFGFVPANYSIAPYSKVPSCKEEYQALQDAKDYVGQIQYISQAFDRIVVCVPKDMFKILTDGDAFQYGKVIAVTSQDFEGLCKERGWVFLPRSGARVGSANADRIVEIVESLNPTH